MMPPADRDAALQHGLSRLPGDPSPEGPECLDAETVAAWMDRSLDAAAVEQALAHVAGCARCQALVAAVARSAEQEAVESNSAAPDASAPGGARVLPWRRRWVAWAVPLSAAATILLAAFVWLRAPAMPDGTVERAAQPVAPAATGGREQAAAGPGSAEAPAADGSANTAAPTSAAVAPAAAPPAQQPPAPRRTGAPGDTPPVASPGAPQAKAIEPPLAGASRAASSERARLQAAAPQSAAASAAGAAPAAAAEALAAPAAPPAPAATRDRLETRRGAPRWRVVEGRLEGSDDGGRAWRTAAGPVTALSSDAGAVVWAVGRAGLVLRTTDGTSWVRVAAPAAADLIEVRATDARTATVRAADGRAWSTTDGGSTWAVVR